MLDCIGDFALLGTDLAGHIDACCTGHTMNHAATRLITQAASRSTNRAQAA
ncbi:MAG: UDP-3-O-acyl-N-acetylglucosamine deacetylase [Planctomycetaceae bacterium]